jgi:TRAP-type C4-dicarboxylate transport system permease small subunit
MFMALVFYKGIEVCVSLYQFQHAAVKLSKAIPFFAIPLGGILIVFVTIAHIVEDWKELRKK